MDILKAFVSWSGGKDSSLACYKAMKEGVKVVCLVNMLSEDGIYSRSHGISSELLRLQAEAIEIPIIQGKTTWDSYEENFKKTLLNLKKIGVNAGVFGDIDLEEHRDWVERVCRETGIKAILPLWKTEREELLEEFINSGFKAIVCAVNSPYLDSKWLGRQIDFDFIKDLKGLKEVDLCGEKGEYHTFVYDGPIFKKAIRFRVVDKFMKDEKWFLKIERE